MAHDYSDTLRDIQKRSARNPKLIRQIPQSKKFLRQFNWTTIFLLDFLKGRIYRIPSDVSMTGIAFVRYFTLGLAVPSTQMMVVERHVEDVNAIRSFYAIADQRSNVFLIQPSDTPWREIDKLCKELEGRSELVVKDCRVNSDCFIGPNDPQFSLSGDWHALREAIDSYGINGMMPIKDIDNHFYNLCIKVQKAVTVLERRNPT